MMEHRQLSTILEELLGPEWKTEAIAQPFGDEYRFDVYTRINVTREDISLSALVDRIKNRFRGSPFYRQTVDELQSLIQANEKEIALMKEEIERLKVFENHHKIEMELRHGNNVTKP
jgi:hypothetical protein